MTAFRKTGDFRRERSERPLAALRVKCEPAEPVILTVRNESARAHSHSAQIDKVRKFDRATVSA
jgi:hypothetical protein